MRGEDALADDRVLGHDLPLVARERAVLVQQLLGHGELADVVQQRGVGDALDVIAGEPEHHRDAAGEADELLGVLVGVVVALLDRRGQRLHGGGGAGAAGEQRELLLDLRVGDGDPALAGALGEHQRAVGLLEQAVGVEPVVPGGDADRALAADRVAAALGDLGGRLLVGAGEQQDELVAAVAGDLVVRPQLALQRAGDAAQQLVAGGVALGVVDALEVVEVEDHGAERVAVAAGAGDLLADAQLHRAVVEDARERVGAGDVLDVLVGLGVAAGERGQAGDRLERLEVLVVDAPAGRPADGERAAQLVVPRHRDGHRGLELAHDRVVGLLVEALVVVADERLAGLQHVAGGARARA